MKTLALTALNVVLFVLSCRGAPVTADVPSVIRARSLQIIDDRGHIRASLEVLPGSDTSILRLSDANGRPEVKLAASEKGSGLSIVGATDENYVVVSAEEAPVIRALVAGKERRLLP
jgi:hypothetical protein